MKKRILSVLLCMALVVSGCSSVIELTSEEENLVAEYAAGVVIKKYKESKGLITDTKKEEQTNTDNTAKENPTISETMGSENGISETTGTGSGLTENNGQTDGSTSGLPADGNAGPEDSARALEQVLKIQGVELSYLGYSVEDKYPVEEFSFGVEAGNKHKLLVVEYDVWNSVDSDAVMEVDATHAVIKAQINGSSSVNVYKTMLNNDLMNMNGSTFTPGEAKTGVLIFRITDEMAENITSVNINVTEK